MRVPHPVNSLAVIRNQWLILLSKILLFLNLVKQHQKFIKFQIGTYFFSGLSSGWVNNNFVIFSLNESCKRTHDPYCHLVALTGSRFYLVVKHAPQMSIDVWACKLHQLACPDVYRHSLFATSYPSGAPFRHSSSVDSDFTLKYCTWLKRLSTNILAYLPYHHRRRKKFENINIWGLNYLQIMGLLYGRN
jgi:hypothetical protein